MENAYGIEAARAKLGEIADHARTTGETIALTRHGRTVAVIGPAHAVKPIQGVDAVLYMGASEWMGRLPGVPSKGDSVFHDAEAGEERWVVADVQWHLDDSGDARLCIHLSSIIDD